MPSCSGSILSRMIFTLAEKEELTKQTAHGDKGPPFSVTDISLNGFTLVVLGLCVYILVLCLVVKKLLMLVGATAG